MIYRFILAIALLCLGGVPAVAQRLTLASHTPIMLASQAAKSTIFLDCWRGRMTVTSWNGSADITSPISGCEASASLQSSGMGLLNAGDVFDVVWNGSTICIPTNGSGAGWSGDGGNVTQRGSGYSAIDEVSHAYPTNTNAIMHCYNGATDLGPIPPGQGALQGSICTDDAFPGKVSYVRGHPAAGGGGARLCVYNVDSERIDTEVTDNGSNWTFLGYSNGGTIVNVENLDTQSGGGIGNRVTFLSGLARHSPLASAVASTGSSLQWGVPGAYCGIGFALDQSGPNVIADRLSEHMSPSSSTDIAADGIGWRGRSTGNHVYEPMVGRHYIQALEFTDGLERCWYRSVGGQRNGLSFSFQN